MQGQKSSVNTKMSACVLLLQYVCVCVCLTMRSMSLYLEATVTVLLYKVVLRGSCTVKGTSSPSLTMITVDYKTLDIV